MYKLLNLLLIVIILPVMLSCGAIPDKVAVIPLNGVITTESRTSVLGGYSITPGQVREYLQRAQKDPTVKAIVIQLNTPGGDVSACQEIVYEIERMKKPVVVSMQSIATSGGYYISAKAAKIIALPSTLTGGIGVISEIPSLRGLLDKLGIKMEVIKAGKYKDMYAGLRDLTPEEQQILQDTTDELYGMFIDVVAQGRHMELSKVRQLATGQAYTGRQALQFGLVDELGDLQTAIDVAAGIAGIDDPSIETYRRQSSGILQLLSGSITENIVDSIGAGTLAWEDAFLLEMLGSGNPRFMY